MGKRSNFEHRLMQKYYTPYEAVVPLLPHLPPHCDFIEPCAGDGRLIRHLNKHGHFCVYACDISPEGEGIEKKDVLLFDNKFPKCDFIITNPPFEREPMHRMIEVFRQHAPTFLLFQSDWHDTKQSKPYMEFCQKIIPVGRISWMENGVSGFENMSWYLFTKEPNAGFAKFMY
jgi:hypothetical protein